LKAAVLTAIFGGLLAQIALRLPPLANVATTFPVPDIYWLISFIAAVLSVCVLIGGKAFSRRNKRPAWIGILAIGIFLVIAVFVVPGGAGGGSRHSPPLDFLYSMIEVAMCAAPAALLGNCVSA
jgi:hypothetical protein